MLKGIPNILPPELLKVLMEMGHGDQLVLADGNFPKFGHPGVVIRCDGHGIPELLDAVLRFMPLDTHVDCPTTLMAVTSGEDYKPEIWETFREIGTKHEKNGLREEAIERFAFYEKARKAYAVVTTSEKALYANIILQKGVVVQ